MITLTQSEWSFLNTLKMNKLFIYSYNRDLIPIIAALELNSFFLQFRCSHLKLSHECSERLLAVLKKSATLEEIYVDNAGFKG